MPRYHRTRPAVTAILHALSHEYQCKVLVGIEGTDFYIAFQGRVRYLGSISDIKPMTLRGLLSKFEEITQEWRYHAEDTTSCPGTITE
jgi:hypothetical protein